MDPKLMLPVLLTVSLAACVDKLPAKDLPCPCAEGWVCDRSNGEPGVCRPDEGDGGPAGPAAVCPSAVVSFLDRFDDGSMEDWTALEDSVSLEDEMLLVLRTDTTGRGLARRPINVGRGAFSVELDLQLHTGNSRASFAIGKAGSDDGYSVVLSNMTENGKRTGLALVGHAPVVRTDLEPRLYLREFMPEARRRYHLRLDWQPGGKLTLYLDGKQEAQLIDTTLADFDRLYLGGGQDTEAGNGGAFDDVTLRACDMPRPTIVPDAQNPLWEGSGGPRHVLKTAAGYRLYYWKDEGFGVAQSTDGLSWTAGAQAIEPALIGEKYNRYLALLERGGAFEAWVSGTSEDCIEYTKVYRLSSADGDSWTAGGKVLEHGPLGSYDSRNLDVASVLYDGETYHLYYFAYATEGGDQCASNTPKRRMGIGYATSADGASWTRHGIVIPLGPPGSLDSEAARSPRVGRDASGWWMYYAGTDGKNSAILYATSSDGLVWQRHGPLELEASGVTDEVDGVLYYGCGGALCRGQVTR